MIRTWSALGIASGDRRRRVSQIINAVNLMEACKVTARDNFLGKTFFLHFALLLRPLTKLLRLLAILLFPCNTFTFTSDTPAFFQLLSILAILSRYFAILLHIQTMLLNNISILQHSLARLSLLPTILLHYISLLCIPLQYFCINLQYF